MFPDFNKIFPVEHESFYNELKKWRHETSDTQEKNECVYVLKSIKPVPRVLKTDDDGILYIGKGLLTKNHERIGELINSVNSEKSKQHEAGEKYQRIRESFEIEGLSLCVYLKDDSRKKEEKYLKEYLKEFGELPPLNRQA